MKTEEDDHHEEEKGDKGYQSVGGATPRSPDEKRKAKNKRRNEKKK